MLIAVNGENIRIAPRRGLTGFCQVCDHPVKSYCGEIYIHHWKHLVDEKCDPWKEHETEWHRQWKNEFNEDWQEVVIEENGEKHRADIRTPKGLVLELQNSFISSAVIEEREAFYGNISWLINAKGFKGNFKIGSVVTSELKRLNIRQTSYQYQYNEEEESDEIKNLKGQLEETGSDIDRLESTISTENVSLSKINEYLKDIKLTTANYIESRVFLSYLFDGFNHDLKNKCKEIKTKIESLKNTLSDKEQILSQIRNMPNANIRSFDHYKLVDHQKVSPSSYANCVLVEKETQNSLFPTTLHFKSPDEFERSARNQNYILIVDPTEKLAGLESEITEIQNEIRKATEENFQLNSAIETELLNYLTEFKDRLVESIQSKEANLQVLVKTYVDLEINNDRLKELEELQKAHEYKELEKSFDKDRSDIMKKYKGLYQYTWKHKRRSWDYAYGDIYLDFQDHIFKIISDSTLRKMSRKEFINLIKEGY